MAKASGMGQTKRMSIISSEGELEEDKSSVAKDPRLIHPQSPAADTSGNVDFFNNRDYYKIFLETSKE